MPDAALARTGIVEPARLRPPGRSGWRAVTIAVLAAFLPLALTLLILIGSDRVVALLPGTAILTVGCAIIAHRFSAVGVELCSQGVTEYRLLGRRRATPPVHARSALMLPLLDNRTLRPYLQLFLLDEQGRTRLRLRGQFWSDAQMVQVANHFDVPVTRQAEPVSLSEMRLSQRSRLSPAERHPVVAALVTGVVTLLAAVLTIAGVFIVLQLP